MQEKKPINAVRFPALSKKLGNISRSTIHRWIHAKRFPRPISLGANSKAWLEHQVDEWLATRSIENSNETNSQRKSDQ